MAAKNLKYAVIQACGVVIPKKWITAEMETSPGTTTLLAVFTNIGFSDTLDARNCICQMLPQNFAPE